MRIKIAIILVVAMSVTVAYSMPTVRWMSLDAQGFPIFDSDGSTPLTGDQSDPTVGCFIQLIFDGGDGLDPIDLGNTDGHGGNDQVIHWTYIGYNTGLGTIPGYFDSGSDVADTSALSIGDTLWMRAWNAPAESGGDFTAGNAPLSTAIYYGDSTDSYDIPDSGVEQQWQLASSFSTVTAVPEPGTFALFGLGLLTIAARRRLRK